MILQSLRLTNFRNYGDYVFEPRDLTILVGPNGVGKTNLIEAIRCLTIFKSFRAKRQSEIIRWGQEYLRLRAKVGSNDKTYEIEFYQDSQQKQIKINQVKKNISQSMGFFKGILFLPEDLAMIKGAPGLRRKWMDILLSQKRSKYLRTLVRYYQVVKNRNQVLSRIVAQISEQDELEYWDNQLLKTGRALQDERKKMIDFLNTRASQLYHRISDRFQSLVIKPQVRPLDYQSLKQRLPIDLKVSATTIGPHLDDFHFELAGRDIATFGSRGEYRSVILALKILEAEFLAEDNGQDKSIILLDDILSELDSNRRRYLFNLFNSHQVILTTTDIGAVEEKVRKKAKIVNLEQFQDSGSRQIESSHL
jgi:DNA replication and repair protein RecF